MLLKLYVKILLGHFFVLNNIENIPNRMYLECFIGLTEVTKESCCYGYPVTKEKQHGK